MSASHHIASKFESFSKRISSPKCWRFTPARSSFARPGPVDPKVRSVRRSDGSTEWWPGHRPSPRRRELSRATSSRWCSQILQGGARKRRYSVSCKFAQTLAASRRLRDALKSCSQRHLRYCMLRNYRARKPPRKLDHPNASCRRLRGLGVAHRCARNRRNLSCACFGHAQTRPEITPYPKSARNGSSNRARNSETRPELRAHQNAQYLDQNTSPKRPAQHAHNRKKASCTRDLATPKNASRNLFAVIRCSQWHRK